MGKRRHYYQPPASAQLVLLDNNAISRLSSGSALVQIIEKNHADDQLVVPSLVWAEWLIGESDNYRVSRMKQVVEVRDAPQKAVLAAGVALRECLGERCEECGMRHRPSLVDAVLVAWASEFGSVLYTTDKDDLDLVNLALGERADVRFAP